MKAIKPDGMEPCVRTKTVIRMINDIFVYVEAYSITNGFSLLDDNYVSTATLWEKMGQTKEWDVYSGKDGYM